MSENKTNTKEKEIDKATKDIELVKMVRLIREAKAANADVIQVQTAQAKVAQEPEKPKIEWRLAPGFHWDEYGNCVRD